MACDEFQVELSAWIDGELSGIEHARLAAHLQTCRECNELLRQFQDTSSLLRELPTPRAPAFVTDAAIRLVRAWPQQASDSWTSRLRRLLFEPFLPKVSMEALGLAAAVALAVFVGREESVKNVTDRSTIVSTDSLRQMKVAEGTPSPSTPIAAPPPAPNVVAPSASSSVVAPRPPLSVGPPPGPIGVAPRPPLSAGPPPGPTIVHGPPDHGGPPAHAVEHHLIGRDPGHWTDRDRYAWGHGSWRPYGCRFGRCGYWWWADGYWYFYDHPIEGPPVEVSQYAYPDPSAPSLPSGVASVSPPRPAVSGVVGGAIGGSILGGALTGRAGGAAVGAITSGTTGAAIGAQAERRNGYYLYQDACYYRYPTGEFAVIDPGYCN